MADHLAKGVVAADILPDDEMSPFGRQKEAAAPRRSLG